MINSKMDIDFIINHDKKVPLRTGRWLKAEDEKLCRLMRQYAPLGGELTASTWQKIRDGLGSRTVNQIKHHWMRQLDPAISHQRWSKQEDELLLQGIEKHGTKWKLVALKVPGRTPQQIRQRYERVLCPTINHGPWTQQEDGLLRQGVEQFGYQWVRIAYFINTQGTAVYSKRTAYQCTCRWLILSSKN